MLLPWPNRIAGGRYAFEGRELQLPVNEPRTGCAIHGLTRSLPWALVDAAGDSTTLAPRPATIRRVPVLTVACRHVYADLGRAERADHCNEHRRLRRVRMGQAPIRMCASTTAQPIDDSLLCVPAERNARGGCARDPDRGVLSRRGDGLRLPHATPYRRAGARHRISEPCLPDSDGITRISLAAALTGIEPSPSGWTRPTASR